MAAFDMDPDADPAKSLVIGPNRVGNLLEVVVLEFPDGRHLAVHAMNLRPSVHRHLMQDPYD